MSQKKVLLFLLSVFALTAILSFAIPEEGLMITLKFPTPQELLDAILPKKEPEEPQPDPAKLLARAEAARRDSLENERLLCYLQENPARIQFPDSDYALFDALFESLDRGMDATTRIIHYGDSQIEEDRMSATLRELLQERFGGGGPGMLPLMKNFTVTTTTQATGSASHYSAYYFGGGSRADGRYGPLGRSSRLNSDCIFSVTPASGAGAQSQCYNRLTVVTAPPAKEFRIRCGDSTLVARPAEGKQVRFYAFPLPDSSSRAKVSIGAGAEVYGIRLDREGGVSVDNAAMRGCSGTIFSRIEPQSLEDYYAAADVKLIIYQFGGNMVPACTGRKGISHYKELVVRELEYLSERAPGARILFIGPSDMSTNIRGTMDTYPQLPAMVDSLRCAAHECGAAYWDLYAAMGGKGSMARWVRENPPLAGGDYIHFTRKGAETASRLLYNSLMVSYDYYQYRKKHQ